MNPGDLGLDLVRPLAGGDVNRAALVRRHGELFFLKWNEDPPPGLFSCEAAGLEALRATKAIGVPEVVDHGESHLLLEYLPPSPMDGKDLGRALVALHRAPQQARYGFDHDNYLATLPQDNTPDRDWARFWADRRLAPLLPRLPASLRPGLEAMLLRLSELLPAAPPASLLHGDLWSGNVMGSEGRSFLVDPAVAVGDREVDLAMAALFGGFPHGFEQAVTRAWPLEPGWRERRPLYQLYYLLVHVILFGGGYVHQAANILASFT